MDSLSTRQKAISIGILVLVLGAIGYGIYSYERTVRDLRARIAAESQQLKADRDTADGQIKNLADSIAKLESANSFLSDALLTEQQQSTLVAEQVGAVSNTVGDLQKLSKTDPELLKKYSKVYFLNEHYVPVSLAVVDPKYVNPPTKTLQIHSDVKPHLESLLAGASEAGFSLQLDSAYRSFSTQAVLKSSYRFTYGAGTANSFSAEQGYSEHQLGTAVDFTTQKLGGGLSGFDKTPEYLWLTDNAYKYGFVLSYPKNNGYYMFEPWHWRFVGIKLATDLHAEGKYFYNTDQREIDTYLADIFD